MNRKNETRIEVGGMTCGSCVRHVDEALRSVSGVSAVDIALREGLVTVTHDARAAPVERLLEAVRDAGYEAAPAV